VSKFPAEVRRLVGGALWDAQIGRKTPYVKPLKGFGDAGVLEIVDNFNGDTFRALYTVRFAKAVFEQRLRRAREDYEQWTKSENSRSR
jgi:phage-related protein